VAGFALGKDLFTGCGILSLGLAGGQGQHGHGREKCDSAHGISSLIVMVP
jgi:hypothetical protein